METLGLSMGLNGSLDLDLELKRRISGRSVADVWEATLQAQSAFECVWTRHWNQSRKLKSCLDEHLHRDESLMRDVAPSRSESSK